MSRHFHRELDRLKDRLLALGGHVEQNVERALQAIERRDVQLARDVIEKQTPPELR